jgi:hypothetical protein
MKHDADYFLKKFEAIPEGQWCVGMFTDEKNRHCALGWCESKKEQSELERLFKKLNLTVPSVNDYRHTDYPQPTPRQRIIAALCDIRETKLRR